MEPIINDIYLGSLGHADDLKYITPNIAVLEQQVFVVRKFSQEMVFN